MDAIGKTHAFFFQFQSELTEINEQPEKAKNNLIGRDPVLYQKTMFMAFLNLRKEDVDEMTMREYMDNVIMLREVLKLWHAPFQKEDD